MGYDIHMYILASRVGRGVEFVGCTSMMFWLIFCCLCILGKVDLNFVSSPLLLFPVQRIRKRVRWEGKGWDGMGWDGMGRILKTIH